MSAATSPLLARDGAAYLLARANCLLARPTHLALAASPSVRVRAAWAARGDIPADVCASALDRETEPVVRLLLSSAAQMPVPALSGGPWEDAAVVLHPMSPDGAAEAALGRLEESRSLARPWEAVLARLAPTIGALPRYPRVLALALRSSSRPAPAMGAGATEEVLGALIQAAAKDPAACLLACWLAHDRSSAHAFAQGLHAFGIWGRAAALALTDPAAAWRACQGSCELPVALSLRAVCAVSASPTVRQLAQDAVSCVRTRAMLGVPLIANERLSAAERSVLADAERGVLPPACPVRGPAAVHVALPSDVVRLRRTAADQLSECSVGEALLEVADSPPAWETACALWEEWDGTVEDLLAVSGRL